MTASRDPDRLVRQFLMDGPAELSPRLAQAIRDDVRQTDQRVSRRPWRIPSMSRPILIFIVLGAALLLGGAVWLGAGGIGPSTPIATPAASAVAVAPAATPTTSSPPTVVEAGDSWLVYENADEQVGLIRPDGSGDHALVPGPDSQATPDWSPDGSQVAWIRQVADAAELWVAGADGASSRRLTQDMSSCGRTFTCTVAGNPRWSADGSSIAFIRTTYDQSRYLSSAVEIVDVATGSVRTVFETAEQQLKWVDWSPDGTQLVVELDTYDNVATDVTPTATTLALLEATAGATPKPIPNVPVFAGHPDWGQGGAILFRTNPYSGGVLAQPDEGTMIRTINPDGTGMQLILASGPGERILRGVSWAPDGSAILHAALDPVTGISTLRMADADGTHERSATGDITTKGGEPRLRPLP